ncbi:MAG TPA: hypothetical protein VFY22_14825 [Hydrogenophaga sp.]|nr:hypothetical protein [Hydrogenophaga sp.]
MNNHFFFLAGAGLIAVIGIIHSVLGEVLIFRRMRISGWVPTDGGSILLERHVRILWATWHLVTVIGFLVAVLILHLGQAARAGLSDHLLLNGVVGAMALSAALVLVGTRGRHPGWVGLLAVALLVAAGAYAP